MSEESANPSEGGATTFSRLQAPVDVAVPDTEPGVSPLGRLGSTWIGVFVVLALFISIGIAGWLSYFIVHNSDFNEQQDFDQLQRIVDPLQSIATLMIGTIFGFAIQSGATAANKAKADKNKDEADKQHGQATKNAEIAKTNAKAAASQAVTANHLLDAAALMRAHYVPREDPPSRVFIQRTPRTGEGEEPHVDVDSYINQAIQTAKDGRLLKASEYQDFL